MTNNRILLVIVILLACASFGFLYTDYLPKLFTLWNSEDFSYCYLVPVIFVYLIWRKLDTRFSPSPVWAGAVFLFTFLFYYVGQMAAMGSLVYFSMWGFLVASFMAIYGYRFVIENKFPMIVLLFFVPIPSFLTTVVTFRLRLISSWFSEILIKLFGIPVFREGNTLDLGSTSLQVVDACSGLRYLMPSILLAMLVGHFYLNSRFRRFLLVLLSIPISTLSNSIRIFVVAVVSKYISVEVATGIFHDFAGLLIFMTTIILVVGCVLVLRRGDNPIQEKRDGAVAPKGITVKETAFWVVVCALSAWLSFHQGNVAEYDPMKSELSSIQIKSDSHKRLFLSKEDKEMLKPDEYFMGTYSVDGSFSYVFITKYLSQSLGRLAHYPVTCLVGSGWSVEGTATVHVPYKGVSLPFRQTVLNKDGSLLISRILYIQRSRLLTDPLLYKFYLLYDGFWHDRTDGVLVRFDMNIPRNVSLDEANKRADAFSVRIIDELEKLYKESPFASN